MSGTRLLKDGRRLRLRPAAPRDVPGLLNLYFRMYRGRYPLAFGTDEAVMSSRLADPQTLWLAAVQEDPPPAGPEAGVLGSVLLGCDPAARIGKAMGLVVDRTAVGNRLGEALVCMALEEAIVRRRAVDSVYATTRTVDSNPQRILQRAGFFKLGLFPNCRKVEEFETMTLMVHYMDGVLARRAPPGRLPKDLAPLLEVAERELRPRRDAGPGWDAQYADLPLPQASSKRCSFEALEAPRFVRRRYEELKARSELRLDFYPFHEPNLLLVSEDGSAEVVFHFNRKDSYCVCLGAKAAPGAPVTDLAAGVERALRRLGASYLEILAPLREAPALQAFLAQRYVPSAYYPAMRPSPGEPELRDDYVVLSKTFEPFDFRGVHLLGRFREYLDAYLAVWKKYYIDAAVRVDPASG